MHHEDREIFERDIFSLSTTELEDGERPGWIKKVVYIIPGEYVAIRIEAEWHIGHVEAFIRRRAWIVMDTARRLNQRTHE